MEDFPVNVTDVAVVVTIVVSGVLALARGFVKELLSVGAWVGAAVATLYGFPYAQPYARDLISVQLAADAAAGIAIFIVTLILFSAITHWIANHIRQSYLSTVDRILGLVFGLVRGALVVCLAWLLVDWAIEEERQPEWLTGAHSLPLVKQGAKLLVELVPEDLREQGEEAIDATGAAARKAIGEEVDRQVGAGTSDKGGETRTPDAGAGYSKDQRQELDKLIEGNQ